MPPLPSKKKQKKPDAPLVSLTASALSVPSLCLAGSSWSEPIGGSPLPVKGPPPRGCLQRALVPGKRVGLAGSPSALSQWGSPAGVPHAGAGPPGWGRRRTRQCPWSCRSLARARSEVIRALMLDYSPCLLHRLCSPCESTRCGLALSALPVMISSPLPMCTDLQRRHAGRGRSRTGWPSL